MRCWPCRSGISRLKPQRNGCEAFRQNTIWIGQSLYPDSSVIWSAERSIIDVCSASIDPYPDGLFLLGSFVTSTFSGRFR